MATTRDFGFAGKQSSFDDPRWRRETETEAAVPGKRTLVEQAYASGARQRDEDKGDEDEREGTDKDKNDEHDDDRDGERGATRGRPLPSGVRSRMEYGFGADLSAVRVFEGAYVAALGAIAYTQGSDIHFAPGKFDPGSRASMQLLGHELAHVMQQAQGRVRATAQAKGLGINDDHGLEREADDLGIRAARGERVARGGWSPAWSGGTAAQRKAAPIQMAPPGEIEHIDNSCYAASILTLLAMVNRYAEAFDPQTNPIVIAEDDEHKAKKLRAIALQKVVHPLIVAVQGQQRITAHEMDQLVGMLAFLGLTMGESDDQQDAAQVMLGMLELVLHGQGSQGLTALSHEKRTYDSENEEGNESYEDQVMIQVGPMGQKTLEGALKAQFPQQRAVNTQTEGVVIDNPHTLSRQLIALPQVLTISVTHDNDHDVLDMPQEFTLPTEIAGQTAPLPRYRLRGFIMRNHSGTGGGHYISYVTDDNNWFQSDDMGGGPLPIEKIHEEKESKQKDSKDEKEKDSKQEKRTATVAPRVQQVGDMSTERYRNLPSQAFALGHVYTYELIGTEQLDAISERESFGDVEVDELPTPPEYKPSKYTPSSKRKLAPRTSPWQVKIDDKDVDLAQLSIEQLVALLDGGKLFPKPPASDAPLLVYLTSRARNEFYESINHVPGYDPSDGSETKKEGALPTQAHDEGALYRRALEASRMGSAQAGRYLRVMEFRFTLGAKEELKGGEQREQYTAKVLSQSGIGDALAGEYVQWQRGRGEQVEPQALRGTGDALSELVAQGATPKAIVDELIRQCPELCEKYRVECASNGMRFYEHAQMVMGQYLKYFTKSEHPLVPLSAMVKMILFHDLDKKLALALKKDSKQIESQVREKGYSGLRSEALSQRVGRKGKDSEHGLTRVMMQKYGGLWDNLEEQMLVTEMVDGDPIGELMKGVHGKDKVDGKAIQTALDEICDMAQRAGIARTDGDGIRDFYHHVKMFYQADSSSYSGDSSYAPWSDRNKDKPTSKQGNDKSQLSGLYAPDTESESGGFMKNESGYLQMIEEVQTQALLELEQLLAKLPASKDGTARDTVKDRQGWDTLTAYRWSDIQIIKEIGNGSTKPLHVRDLRDGNKEKFLKLGMAQDPIHVMTEGLTNQLYDQVGAPVPDFELILIEGQPALIATWNTEHSVPKQKVDLLQNDDFLSWVGADFLFGNFDLFKLENWSIKGRRMLRADNGGALDYRAQGVERKPEQQWEGTDVKEQMSMRTFGKNRDEDPYKDLTDRRVAYSIIRVLDFLDGEAIDRALAEAHAPVHRRAYIRETLLRRLDVLAQWAREQIDFEEVKLVPATSEHATLFYSGIVQLLQGLMQSRPSNTNVKAPEIDHETDTSFLDVIKKQKLDKRFYEDLERMRHGVLIRRCAPQEAEGFKTAATNKDPEQRNKSVFGGSRDPWKRGEVVFSVNRAYEFKREDEKDKEKKPSNDNEPKQKDKDVEDDKDGKDTIIDIDNVPTNDTVIDIDDEQDDKQDDKEPLLPKSSKTDVEQDTEHGTSSSICCLDLSGALSWLGSKMPWAMKEGPSVSKPNYDYMMEIPITDEALEFIKKHFLIQGGSYDQDKKPNPNLKYERVTTGLPNVILRGHGFENIWSCFDKVRIYQPDEHVSVEPIPGGEEAVKLKLEQFKKLQEEAKLRKEEKEKEKEKKKQESSSEDDDDYGSTFWNSLTNETDDDQNKDNM